MPRFVALTTLFLVLCSAVWGAEPPVAVSPGDSSTLALIGDACPTFSWGGVEGAKSYELVVYRVDETRKEAEPVLRQAIAGSALGWTPSLDRCLERGGQYAWSVQAVSRKEASDWSAPNLFEVAPGPSEVEFEEAVAVVRQYLAERNEVEAATAGDPESSSETSPRASTEATEPLAPPGPTLLSVDGNVDAASFTGDGANLAGVATDAELTAHGGDASAHHIPPTSLPPSGAAGGDLTGVYPDPTIAADAVGSNEIVDGSIAEGDLAFDPATQAELDALIAALNAFVESVVPSQGLATTSIDVTVIGSGFETGSRVFVGGVEASCTVDDTESISCSFPANGGAAERKDVRVELLNGISHTLQDGFTYTGVLPDPGVSFFCNIQFPLVTTTFVGVATESIFGQIFVAGQTDSSNSPGASIRGQVGFGADGSDPTAVNWSWFDTQPSPGFDFSQNNDEHVGTMTAAVAGTYDYAYRFSTDDGLNYFYCDTNGSDDGYSPANAGDLTVNP